MWSEAFRSHEQQNTPESSVVTEERPPVTTEDPDELAKAAGQVLDAVRHEQNPKFQNSQFLGLMKQLRDREVIVEGNKMIPKEDATEWASDFQSSLDMKGKGKAVDLSTPTSQINGDPIMSFAPPPGMLHGNVSFNSEALSAAANEIDEYFRQDNEDYINYWHGASSAQPAQQKTGSSIAGLPQGARMNAEWDTLQRDWERFEATATGLDRKSVV